LCFGVYLDNGLITPAEVMGMGLVWFYGFAVSFVPLKIAAWLFGWKIWFVGEDRAAETQGRYGIRDMMVGTSVLALALAIGRAFIPGELPSWSQVLRASGLESYEALLALFLFSIISLVVKLPCIWIALATPRDKVVSRSGFWILCSAGLGCVETVLLAVLVGITGSELGEILLGLVAGHAAMAALMIVVLYGLRSFGYRMTRQRTVIRVAD
jgi:hypothetical protein